MEEHHTTPDKLIYLWHYNPSYDGMSQDYATPEKLTFWCISFSTTIRVLWVWLKNTTVKHLKSAYLCIPNMTAQHPSTTPEKSAYLCVALPWHDCTTSQYNTWEVSVPVCCPPLAWLHNIPVQHLRSQRTCVLPSPGMTEEVPVQHLRSQCTCVSLIWLNNVPVQHLRSQRTCVLPSPGMTEEDHSTTPEKSAYLFIPDMTEECPSTTPEKSAYLCVAFPWYDWRTSQYNTWEVSVPVYCLPLVWLKNVPVQHLRSQRTCVLPSTVPTGPLHVSVSVLLTFQEVTPLGVAVKVIAPGVTERNRRDKVQVKHRNPLGLNVNNNK